MVRNMFEQLCIHQARVDGGFNFLHCYGYGGKQPQPQMPANPIRDSGDDEDSNLGLSAGVVILACGL